MSTTNNTKRASFDLEQNPKQDIVRNNSEPTKNTKNTEKPKEDYTGFNHADFASWAKSSTGKPFNQPQINAAKQQRVDNEWFDYAAFVTWAKSPVGQD
jgi:hypothetical protein